MGRSRLECRAQAWRRCAAAYFRGERGNIATVVALAIVPIAGMLSIAGEVSGWWAIQRSAQNAADSAAIAAANNNDVATFQYEAQKVAAKMNFAIDSHTSVVAAQLNQATCPASMNPCYKVTIVKSVPLYMSQVVGYRGTGGSYRQTITASAIAGLKYSTTTYCFFAMSTSGTGFTVNGNGGAGASLNGCSIASLSGIKCPNSATNSMDAGTVSAAGSISGNYCASNPSNQVPNDPNPPTDHYAGVTIPSAPCTTGINWSGSVDLSGKGTMVNGSSVVEVCGDINITTNTQIHTANPGTVLVIKNGSLNISAGATLKIDPSQAPDSAGLTIFYTGSNGFNHLPPTSGTLDMYAPTSGTYKWIAMYQDPALTSVVSFTASGSKPTWDVTGLLYFPHANITWSGNLNKATNGANCFALEANTITLNGSVNITENQSQCPIGSLFTPPSNNDSPIVALAG